MIFVLKIKDDTNINTILAHMIIIENERTKECKSETTEKIYYILLKCIYFL